LFYTGVACFVKHTVWYQNCIKITEHLLSNYLLKHVYWVHGMLWGSLWWTLFICISQSVAVYTGYVVTEHEGNMNMGQYYSYILILLFTSHRSLGVNPN